MDARVLACRKTDAEIGNPRGRRGPSVQVSAVDERSSLTRCPQTQKIRTLAAAQITDEAHASRDRTGQRATERCEAVDCRLAPARDGRDSDRRDGTATRALAARRLSGTVQDSRGRRIQVSSAPVRRPNTNLQHKNRSASVHLDGWWRCGGEPSAWAPTVRARISTCLRGRRGGFAGPGGEPGRSDGTVNILEHSYILCT